jgi:hypothetical protein
MSEILFPNFVPPYLESPYVDYYDDGTIQKSYLDGVIVIINGDDAGTETLFPDSAAHIESTAKDGPEYIEDAHDNFDNCLNN